MFFKYSLVAAASTSAVQSVTCTRPKKSVMYLLCVLLKYRIQNPINLDDEISVASSTIKEYAPLMSWISSVKNAGAITADISLEVLVLCSLVFSKILPLPRVFNVSPRWSILCIEQWEATKTAKLKSEILFLSLIA